MKHEGSRRGPAQAAGAPPAQAVADGARWRWRAAAPVAVAGSRLRAHPGRALAGRGRGGRDDRDARRASSGGSSVAQDRTLQRAVARFPASSGRSGSTRSGCRSASATALSTAGPVGAGPAHATAALRRHLVHLAHRRRRAGPAGRGRRPAARSRGSSRGAGRGSVEPHRCEVVQIGRRGRPVLSEGASGWSGRHRRGARPGAVRRLALDRLGGGPAPAPGAAARGRRGQLRATACLRRLLPRLQLDRPARPARSSTSGRCRACSSASRACRRRWRRTPRATAERPRPGAPRRAAAGERRRTADRARRRRAQRAPAGVRVRRRRRAAAGIRTRRGGCRSAAPAAGSCGWPGDRGGAR